MSRRNEEITATYQRERKRFENPDGDVLISDVIWHEEKSDGKTNSTKLTVKCIEENNGHTVHPVPNRTYRFFGLWDSYTNRYTGETERQFHARSFTVCQPHGRAGVVAYLAKAPRIGKATAGKIYDAFQSDAVKILRTQPEEVAKVVPRLTVESAMAAAEWLDREKKLEDCTIELVDLLDGRKFPRTTIKNAIARFGNVAAQIIKANPYILMGFRGCGFKLADSLYLDLGYPPAALKRQALCAWYEVNQKSNQSGDTWQHAMTVHKHLGQSIGGTSAKAEKALRLAVRGQILSTVYTDGRDGEPAWDGNCMWVADERKSNAERELGQMIAAAMQEPGWSGLGLDVSSIPELSDHQKDGLSKAFSGGSLALLCGYAGTGKSFSLVQLLRILLPIFTAQHIAIAAPTGRAAVRIKEVMAEYGISLHASTIHSLLGVKTVEGGGWHFRHNEENPLPYKLLIFDELSMAGTPLMRDVFAARAEDCLVLGLGDTAQLAPVEHGAPLRDMIAAGVPSCELTEVRRNAGGIVRGCNLIREGKSFEYMDNLHLISRADPENQKLAIVQVIDAVSKKLGLDPVWDFQVVCAVNKASDTDRKQLNTMLQNHLNPSPVIRDCQFRLKDKVINTKNGWLPASDSFWNLPPVETQDVMVNDDGKIYVANGDFGYVSMAAEKFYEVVLQAPKRIVIVPRGRQSDDSGDDESSSKGCAFELGYAATVHKFQGSQVPVVIVVLDGSTAASRTCDRSWLYTAYTRGKLHTYAIGRREVGDSFIKRLSITRRKTFLQSWIREGLSEF
jgi:exodeoxyribonuclease V alpha subunit